MIAALKDTCDIISEENTELKDTLNSIMSDCAGEVNGIESYKQRLEQASKKINRVIHYQDSFQKYEAELKNGVQDLEDIYNPLYMSEQELQAVMQQFLEEGNIEGMQQVANQIFAQDIFL